MQQTAPSMESGQRERPASAEYSARYPAQAGGAQSGSGREQQVLPLGGSPAQPRSEAPAAASTVPKPPADLAPRPFHADVPPAVQRSPIDAAVHSAAAVKNDVIPPPLDETKRSSEG